MNRKGSKSVFLFFFVGKAERERKGRGREKNKRRHEGSDGRAARQFSWGLQIGNWTINDLGRVSAYLCTCYFDGGTSTPRQSAYLRSAPPSYRQNRSLIQSLLADSRFLSRRLAPIFSQFRVYFLAIRRKSISILSFFQLVKRMKRGRGTYSCDFLA